MEPEIDVVKRTCAQPDRSQVVIASRKLLKRCEVTLGRIIDFLLRTMVFCNQQQSKLHKES